MTDRELRFEDLVAGCAERFDRDGETALEAACDAHPEHAAALRQAIGTLREFGLVGATAPAPGTAPGPAAAPARLGEFEVVREIGRGGMGVVYEARQPTLDRTVALKVLPTAWVLDPRQVTRFQNEARAAATLDHPHIVRVHVVGNEAGTHFYAMQLIDGVSLRQLLRERRGAMPADAGARAVLAGLLPGAGHAGGERPASGSGAAWIRRAADLARQAASALAKAHAVGILHRDVKPGNLLVDRTGHLWVTDFGLAHFARDATDLTRSGEFVGTLAYSSPEQIGGRVTVDARSDVYSLGATLYELLTLRPPFAADDHAALVRQIAQVEPVPLRELDPRIPRDLETIQQKAMAKEPTQRYQTAAALAADLDAFQAGRPIEARPVTAVQRGVRWCQRNPTLAGALLAILVLVLVVGGVGYSAVRAVTAERALARLSSEHLIDSRRQAAESLRRSLAAGRRSESLRLLREATAEIDRAAPTQAAGAALRAQLRADVLASLSLWDATVEAIPGAGAAGTVPLAFDDACSVRAVQQGGEILLHDASGLELARLANPGAPWARFSPDGEWLAISNPDGPRLWHWRSGRVLAPAGPGTTVHASCFDRASRRFFVCVAGHRLKTCDLGDGGWRDLLGPVAQRFASEHGEIHCLALSPDGRSLATCQDTALPLAIYDLAEDRAPRGVVLPDYVIACSWSDDGRHVLVGGRFQDLLTIDAEAGRVVESWPGHHAEVCALTRSHGRELVASSGWDGQLFVWDRYGRGLVSLVMPTPARQLQFTGDDRAVGWSLADGDLQRLVRWRLQPPAVLREFATSDRPPSSIPWTAFHPTAPLIAVSVREAVLLFDGDSGERLGELPAVNVRRLRFLPDGSLLVAQKGAGACCRYPVTVTPGEIRVGPAQVLAQAGRLREADAQGDVLCVWDGERLKTITLDDRELASVDAPCASGAHLRAAPGGRHAALGTFGGDSVVVWDLATGRRALEVPVRQRSGNATFAPDGRRLVVSRCDEHRVYETGSWGLLQVVPRRRLDSLAGYPAFAADGTLLALPMTRSRLQICDGATLAPLFELEMPDGSDLGEPAFSPDGTRLVLVSAHRKVFVWDLREARAELRAVGLDWSDAPIPPAAPVPSERVRLVIER